MENNADLSFSQRVRDLGTESSGNAARIIRTDWRYISVLFLFCVLIIYLPILIAGFPYGSDQRQHLRFAIAVRTVVAEGKVTPNWTDYNAGFGEIGIRFYPPVAYLTTAAFHVVVRSWYDAFTLNLILWMFIGSLGMYIYCREWVEPQAALLSGLLFALVPYHLTQIFQYFLYAEFAAFSLLPFCFLYLTRVGRDGTQKDMLWLAAVYSILVLTHIPLTLICTISMLLYALVVIDWSKAKVVVPRLLIAGGFAVLLTAFRLINLMRETPWLSHNTDTFTEDHYSFSSWLFPNVLYTRRFLLIEQVSLLFDTTIILTALLAVPAIIFSVMQFTSRRDSKVRVVAALAISAMFSFFMLSRFSFLVWDSLPLLQKVQFPWRWLSPLSFFAVAGLSLGGSALIARSKRWTRPLLYLGGALIFAIILYDVTQSIAMAGGQTRGEFAQMVAGVREDQDADYWWPIWAKKAAFDNAEKVSVDSRSYTIQRWDRETRAFSVDAGPAQDVRVATFYYPYWRATVNGSSTEISKDSNGVIVLNIPAETTQVSLMFTEPAIYRVADWISIGAWSLILGLLLCMYPATALASKVRKSLN